MSIQVMSNIVEPALQACPNNDQENPMSQETFLIEFKKVIERVVQHLKEQPVIVAHSEHTFDGSGIKRLLSNKFELEKVRSLFQNLKLVLAKNLRNCFELTVYLSFISVFGCGTARVTKGSQREILQTVSTCSSGFIGPIS